MCPEHVVTQHLDLPAITGVDQETPATCADGGETACAFHLTVSGPGGKPG
jgi:hypothetical protein